MTKVDRGVFVCSGGCGQRVNGIYCGPCGDTRREAARQAAEERRARMSDPAYQAMLQAARAAKALPAEEGQ